VSVYGRSRLVAKREEVGEDEEGEEIAEIQSIFGLKHEPLLAFFQSRDTCR
jgi:hypothetical protein